MYLFLLMLLVKDFSRRGLKTLDSPLGTTLCVSNNIIYRHIILCILCSINDVYEYGVYFAYNFSWENISKRSTYLCTWTEQECSTRP